MSEWRALSLRQPWLWAVLRAGKLIENRTWSTDLRGPLLLHASRHPERTPRAREEFDLDTHMLLGLLPEGPARDELLSLVELALEDRRARYVPKPDLPRGVFAGVARVGDVISRCAPKDLDWRDPRAAMGSCGHLWHSPPQFGWRLADVRELSRRVEYPGALQLFRVPPAVVAELGLPASPDDWKPEGQAA